MASVRVRTATGLLLALLVAGGLYAANHARAGLVVWGMSVPVALLACFELGRMGKFARPAREFLLPLLTLPAALLILAAILRNATPWQSVGILLSATLLTVLLGIVASRLSASKGDVPAPSGFWLGRWAVGPLAAWVGPPMAGLALVHACFGTAALTTLIILSKVGDIAGYFAGKAIGRSHPFPKLSPGKTTAGCVASLVTGTIAGLIAAQIGQLPGAASLFQGAFVGAALNIAAQAADLFESYMKRSAGVKDSSTMAGASGGVLDVIDSLLFTVPLGLLLFTFLAP